MSAELTDTQMLDWIEANLPTIAYDVENWHKQGYLLFRCNAETGVELREAIRKAVARAEVMGGA